MSLRKPLRGVSTRVHTGCMTTTTTTQTTSCDGHNHPDYGVVYTERNPNAKSGWTYYCDGNCITQESLRWAVRAERLRRHQTTTTTRSAR